MVSVGVTTTGTGLKHPDQAPQLDWFIYLLVAMAVISGFLFGYDTGIVSSAMLYVPRNRALSPMGVVWQEVIVSITPGMAGLSALMAGWASDRYGRRRMIVVSSAIFVAGALVCAVGLHKMVLLAGRILLGIAIGFSSMIVPIYVGESSPAHIRGRLVTGFQLMITFGLVAANLFAAGFAYIDPLNIGWRLMFGFAALPAFTQMVGFAFLPESPRWLFKNGGGRLAAEPVLAKIYAGDRAWIAYELDEIQTALEMEKRDEEMADGPPPQQKTHVGTQQQRNDNGSKGAPGRPKRIGVLRRIVRTPHVRKALTIGCALQMFQQLSGINTIMYYTGAIIRSAGIQDEHTAIWISVGTASVNFFVTFVPLNLVDRVGRRCLLLVSVAAVLCSCLLMGGAFLLINRDSAPVVIIHEGGVLTSAQGSAIDGMQSANTSNAVASLAAHCAAYRNCDFCTTDEHCGFCGPAKYSGTNNDGSEVSGERAGYCYPRDAAQPDRYSAIGQCANSLPNNATQNTNNASASAFEWAETLCRTRFTVLPIILMMVFLCSFAAGYAPIPWVLNAEFYPLWARGTCVSLAVFTNWTFNLIVSLTFLSLNQAATKYGTFFIYAGATAVAFVLFYAFVPETRGLELDEVQLLFKSRRKVAKERQQQQKEEQSVENTFQMDRFDSSGKRERY